MKRPLRVTRKRSKWLRRAGLCLVFLMVALVWLNGPGIRWLLPMVAGHFLEKKSMTIEMEVRGSVAGGLSFHEVHLAGGPIVDLRVSSVQPLYQLHELLDGKVQGIRVDGVMLEMDLDRNPVKAAAAEKSPPFDIRKVIELMRANQKIADGYEVDVQVQSLRVHRNEALVAGSEGIRLSHRAGDDVWQLVTGVWQLPQKNPSPRKPWRSLGRRMKWGSINSASMTPCAVKSSRLPPPRIYAHCFRCGWAGVLRSSVCRRQKISSASMCGCRARHFL